MSHTDRIPYSGKQSSRFVVTDIHLARRMHVIAQQTGHANDYLIAAELFEKCGDYATARQCREAAEALNEPTR
jgi:hypothetical protein